MKAVCVQAPQRVGVGVVDAAAWARRLLSDRTGLGSRNVVGLVHILVSESLAEGVTSTCKDVLWNLGWAMSAKPPQHPEPLLTVSDHCPQVTEIKLR